MKIKTIRIDNVKSFKNSQIIDFDDKMNLLIGSNGSGKSNLLDIITIVLKKLFIKSYTVGSLNTPGSIGGKSQVSLLENSGTLKNELEKYIGQESMPTNITIDFLISQDDINNIKLIKENEQLLAEISIREFGNDQLIKNLQISEWVNTFSVGDVIGFEVADYLVKGNPGGMGHPGAYNHVQTSPVEVWPLAKKTFFRFLNAYELIVILLKDQSALLLKPNFLFFGPYRAISKGKTLQANLSTESYNQALIQVQGSDSKSSTSYLTAASLYFADKRRAMQSITNWEGKWENDPEVLLMGQYLGRLGYSWELKEMHRNQNIYEIKLLKDEMELSLSQTSSGEQEILNYLFGIFALNLRHGLIIIDEPELHLHPKWQKVLLELFFDLSEKTGNQFIISTHSAIFINDKSLNKLLRVYRESKSTKTLAVQDLSGLKLKDLLHIINSTNNEKLFFADLVILVEGATDRLIFQKLFNALLESKNLVMSIEIVDMGGKNNYDKFSKFLTALKIPHYFIADLDYVNRKGAGTVKTLFETNKKKLDKFVFNNESSTDKAHLIDVLDAAITSGKTDDLKAFAEALKDSRMRLKDDLSDNQQKQLSDFILTQKTDRIHILERGDIEKYFPELLKAKDLDNVIKLLSEIEYQKWEKEDGFKELYAIVEEIFTDFEKS